jgi:hypothetical protein
MEEQLSFIQRFDQPLITVTVPEQLNGEPINAERKKHTLLNQWGKW